MEDRAPGYPPDTRQGQYNHIAPQTQPIRPPNPPPNQQGPNNMEDMISDIMRNRFGIETRNRARTYKKSYPDYYDNVLFPRNYRVPKFAKYSGEDVAPLRERLDGQQFLDVSQLMQRALAQESRVKDNRKLARPFDKKPNVQSAIDEGRLKFTDGSKMKLDHDHFPVNTINFNDKKVLIRPEQAESTKGKEVVIGEPRSKMIVLKKPEVGVWKENRSGASTSKAPRKTKVTFNMLLEKYEKQGGEKIRNKGKRPRSPPKERFGHSPRRSRSPSYHYPQDMSWGSYPMPPSGYPYPCFMPWGPTPPMFNHMPPMQFNQGRGGPRRPIHERLSSPNNSRFYGKNRANEEKWEGKRVKVEERTSEVITIKVGSHDVPIPSGDGVGVSPNKKSEAGTSSSQSAGRFDRSPHVGLTSASGRSDRWSTAGLAGLQLRFDERAAKGDVRASSSSSKVNKGHYLPPGIEPNPRWMPKDLTATQKRRLQRLRAQEIREKKAEEQRDKRFNELRPPPVWRPKSIEKEKPVDINEKEEQSVDKGESSPKEDMDINMVCMLPMEFCAMDEAEVAQFSFGPKDAVFEKPDESNRHMKPLYLKGHVDGKPVSRMLVDGGAAVNLMPYSLFKKLRREDDELKKTNMILNGLNGEPTEARGIFSAELTVGNKTLPTAFFIVDVQEWVSSIVPVEKKGSDKIRVCIDFRDLNKATPKDEYPMPIADMMINDASGHKVISFLDGNTGYNQIFMAEEDMYKTAFRCPGFVGLFEWVVMTFGLKNAGATYQRAMNLIFHDLLGIVLEIYIDDIVVKSDGMEGHVANLRLAIERMRRYGLKMNPLKCAFGVSAGKFLGFMVHERGVEIDPKKIEKIHDFKAPTCKKEVQKLLGKVNYLRRFISNLAGKIDAFVPILRLKKEADFTWGAKQQEAFEELKRYLSTPPVVRAPKAGKPFRLYIASEDKVIGAILTQEEDGKEYIITYLSRRLLDAETRPILSGRIGKWAYALIEYDLAYEPLKSMKGQIVCDFIVDHHIDIAYEGEVCLIEVIPWKIYFDGSSCKEGQGIGVVLFSPNGMCYEASVRLKYYCTNNQAEYNALLFGLQVMEMVGAKYVEAFGDSELVVQQLAGVYKCLDGSLNRYLDSCLDIIVNFDNFAITHIAWRDNSRANGLAQQASGYNVKKGLFFILEESVLDFKSLCEIGKTGDQGRSDRPHAAGLTGDPERSDWPCVVGLTGFGQSAGGHVSINLEAELIVNSDICAQVTEEDWRIPLIQYLKDPTLKVDRKIRRQSFKYTLLDGVLLKCLDEDQSKVAMGEGHKFVLVATDYFTKWAEAVPLKNMTHTEANGQAESSNKTLLKLVKKKIEEHPKRWHEVLSEALWAHRISKHGATKVTPFELVYGKEAVLSVEVNLGSLRYIKQDDLSSEDYKTLMGDNLDEVIDKRLRALEEIEKEKKRVAKAYNKRVKGKLFQVGDLVWKTIFPLGTRSKEFGKWSPSWEGPYRVCGIVRGNAYFLETLQGERFQRAINGKYLKQYFPSVWQDA
uniref:OSJNBa0029L02.20 protein n=1 Tax=Oryza sativa subsp. japonica TaxID=39947 RepID=Q7XMR7_ORYSJ|nr:OSJNBa0029L02.20 [Oryza sativa Japonica Group]